jgi:hypothetical protein
VTFPRGRAGDGSAPRGLSAACVLLTLTAAAACARPGDPPGGTPTVTSRTLHASAAPVSPGPGPVPRPATGVSRRPGVAECAQPAEPVTRPVPSHPRGAGPNDAGRPRAADSIGAGTVPPESDPGAEERRRRVLESQQSPVPRRGDVPPGAVAGAEECVRLLLQEFTLSSAGSGRAPGEAGIRAALTNAGLLQPVVVPGPAFAASTGEACIVGTFTDGKPAMTLTPLSGTTCRP